jgi:stage II sporulation protein D
MTWRWLLVGCLGAVILPGRGWALGPDAGPVLPAASEPAPPSIPSDEINSLYSHQIAFQRGGPIVTVRLMEGQSEVSFSGLAHVKLKVHGEADKALDAPDGAWFRVRVETSKAAQLGYAVQGSEFSAAQRPDALAAIALWQSRGYPARIVIEGAMYGLSGHVLDNRRLVVLLGPDGSQEDARTIQQEVARKFGEATLIHTTVLQRPEGTLALLNADGAVLAESRGIIEATDEGSGFQLKRVEYGVGYAFHGFADRRYRGSMVFTLDAAGQLAVINAVPLEELLRGLVPSEIFPKAHPEALKAQAVTARGEILAKIGARHLTDPYLFCSEQHCQVYQGEGGENPATDAAIRATQGLALFHKNGGGLVDTVYSAICGGHTESNENVWAGTPDPALRGVPDLIRPAKLPPDQAKGLGSDNLPAFLSAKQPFACQLASVSSSSHFRWQKRFTGEEVDQLLASLKVGHVIALHVVERGVSGRAIALTVSGDTGAGEIRGELNIRRAFKNLPSGMFIVSSEPASKGKPADWLFNGGGWGHGVGMCQIGAIGRAEHGESFSQILGDYFQDSELVQVY